MPGAWLGRGTPQGEELCFPGRPVGRAADVCLLTYGVRLQVGAVTAFLRWDDYQVGLYPATASTAGWALTHTHMRRRPRGVAVEVLGARCRRAVLAVMQEGGAPTGLRLFLGNRRRVVVAGPHEASDEERDTFRALVTALAHRRSLRPRLATTDRTHALVADIAARPLPNAGRAAVPAGSESVAAAMEALDYSHRIGGRPVAGDVLDPVDRIVARVIQHVIDHRGEPRPDAALVAEVARRYRAVEPWPFAALTHPVAPGAPLAPVRVEHRVGRRETRPHRAGHRPSWWRTTPPWAPPGQPD